MKETRYNLRLTKVEKDLLSAAAKQNGTSIISYIKQKLFINDSGSNEEGVTYELPSKEKHEYFNTWVLHTVYMLLLNKLCEGKTEEEALEIKEKCKKHHRHHHGKLGVEKTTKDTAK